MQCLEQLDSTNFKIADAQPIKYTDCTYLITQPSEISNNPFNLTVDEATELSGSILLLWSIAYIWRTLSKLLENQSNEKD